MNKDIITWADFLEGEKEESYFKRILKYVNDQRKLGKNIFPSNQNIFNAFKYCKFNKLKIIILGQDPYHNFNQADGLAFSVQSGVKIPPSLINISKEIKMDLNIKFPMVNGNLMHWAKQGILLLNTILTVEMNKPQSHARIGWSEFTNKVIQKISGIKRNLVFMMWGTHAQNKINLISKQKNHLVLKSAHPSPFSAHKGFFGCKHFSKANQHLKKNNIEEIDWKI